MLEHNITWFLSGYFRDYLFPKGVLIYQEKATPRNIHFLGNYDWRVDIPLEISIIPWNAISASSEEHSEAGGTGRQNVLLKKLFSKSIGWAFTKVRTHRYCSNTTFILTKQCWEHETSFCCSLYSFGKVRNQIHTFLSAVIVVVSIHHATWNRIW